jgi:hypothetical protein
MFLNTVVVSSAVTNHMRGAYRHITHLAYVRKEVRIRSQQYVCGRYGVVVAGAFDTQICGGRGRRVVTKTPRSAIHRTLSLAVSLSISARVEPVPGGVKAGLKYKSRQTYIACCILSSNPVEEALRIGSKDSHWSEARSCCEAVVGRLRDTG